MLTNWRGITGDLGRRDDEGNYYIVDRVDDMIISGGENIYSVEVERALYEHPSVLSAGVVGTPDRRWGEKVTAFVVLEEGSQLTENDLQEPQAVLADTRGLHMGLARLLRMGAPIVACVHATAMGGALATLANCDLVYGARSARFGGAYGRLIRRALATPIETVLEDEAQGLAGLAGTLDAREGITAFAERRAPVFEGH